MSATEERDQVYRIASTDIARALRLARTIGDPWFRCQSLAFVAWHTAGHESFLCFLAESVESGWSIKDPNRAVTVNAWPVAALARRQFPDPAAMKRNARELRSILARMTKVLAKEPSPASRADALLIHVHALSPCRPEARKEVLALLARECKNPANGKRQRQLEEAALVIAPDDPDTALGLSATLDEGRKRRTIAKIEARSALLGARSFFHLDGSAGL